MPKRQQSAEKLVIRNIGYLCSKSRSRRDREMERIREIGPDVVFLLHHILDKHKVQWRDRRPLMGLSLGCIGFLGYAVVGDAIANQAGPNSAVVAAILGVILLILAGFWSLKSPNMTYHGAAIALANLGDRRSFGRLVEAYHRGDKPVHDPVTRALGTMIPLLSIEDVGSFTHEESDFLYKILAGRDAELVLILLSALPGIEAVEALPYVERLAEGRRLAASNTEIRNAALIVWPILSEMAALRTQHSTLLRAGSPHDSNSETALRPAAYSSESNPEELLRASESSD